MNIMNIKDKELFWLNVMNPQINENECKPKYFQ